MKEKTKNELKHIAQAALKSEYGFEPSMKDIVLLEAYGDGTYILFEVGGHEYSFNSRLMGSGYPFPESVWTGKGTIEKRTA